jgi:hypothetical protein
MCFGEHGCSGKQKIFLSGEGKLQGNHQQIENGDLGIFLLEFKQNINKNVSSIQFYISVLLPR